MKQEPVAFMNPAALIYKQRGTDFMHNDSLYPKDNDWIPLYTEPQYMELSDEEIMEASKDVCEKYGSTQPQAYIDFAKAILRKAQEK